MATTPDRTPTLKPGSALLIAALHRHGEAGAPVTPFAAHKLTYFLRQLGGPFGPGVRFSGSRNGPLSPAVDTVLSKLNGSFLSGLVAGPEGLFAPITIVPANYPIIQRYVAGQLSAGQRGLLDHLEDLLEGYRGVFNLEVLSTVHLVRQFFTSNNVPQVVEITRGWLQRPVEELTTDHVAAAVRRLDAFAGVLAFRG